MVCIRTAEGSVHDRKVEAHQPTVNDIGSSFPDRPVSGQFLRLIWHVGELNFDSTRWTNRSITPVRESVLRGQRAEAISQPPHNPHLDRPIAGPEHFVQFVHTEASRRNRQVEFQPDWDLLRVGQIPVIPNQLSAGLWSTSGPGAMGRCPTELTERFRWRAPVPGRKNVEPPVVSGFFGDPMDSGMRHRLVRTSGDA